jgi:hypothetical protein
MYKALFPSSNHTIYELYPDQNTSVDEILELWPIKEGTSDIVDGTFNSRILIKFDVSNIHSLVGQNTFQSFLSLRATDVNNSPTQYSLFAYPLSGSVTTGTGFFNSNPPFTSGVSWNYKTSKLVGTRWLTGSYNANTTGSLTGGGNWYTNVVASQSFDNDPPDIRMDVTNILHTWLSGSISNDGFILKYKDSDETSLETLGKLQFFSRYSHTIYIPRLEIFWNDSSLVGTGSFTETSSDDTVLYFKNLKDIYGQNEVAVLRMATRQFYPTQTYSTSSNYLIEKRLPVNSFYQIQDVVTSDVIIPFNELGTRVNCDLNGNFVRLDCSSLMPERYYKIVVKAIYNDGSVLFFDNKHEFRITKY